MGKSKQFMFVILGLLMVSCSAVKEPEFKKMMNVNVEDATLEKIRISAEAVYYNPNLIGVKIDHSDVDVIANGIEVGKIDMKDPAKIEAKSEFRIPVEVSFPPSKLLERESGLLSGLLSAYLDRKVDLEYRGHITMDIGGIKFDVPIEFEETVSLKKKK